MTKFRLLAGIAMACGLVGCGGGDGIVKVDCGDDKLYRHVVEGRRIVAPEGLDQLNEFAEMPIPHADPGAAPVPPGRCIDMPPALSSSS